MSGPTRGELDRMASAARRLRRFFNSGSDDLDAVMRMEELFLAYPLPPEDDRLRDALAIASSWVRGEDCALNSLTVEEAIAECCRAAALHQSTLALPPEDGERAEPPVVRCPNADADAVLASLRSVYQQGWGSEGLDREIDDGLREFLGDAAVGRLLAWAWERWRRAAALLRPPPPLAEVAGEELPEDGARAELANRALRHATAIQVAHGLTARVLRECAAALLRQPPPPPAAGVSKAAPENGGRPSYMEMEDAVRALDGAQVDGWIKSTVNRMRTALLRKPAPTAPAGVSKADVRRIISSHLERLRATWDEHYERMKRLPWTATEVFVHQIEADIEALPEAAPRSATLSSPRLAQIVEYLRHCDTVVPEQRQELIALLETHPLASVTVKGAGAQEQGPCKSAADYTLAPPSGADREAAEEWGYGIVDADGSPWFDEICVAPEAADLDGLVSDTEGALRVVRLWWTPLPEAKP